MPAIKTSKKTSPKTNLKSGQKKSVSKWLIVAGVAVVAVAGVLIVRYSGAAGESWSVKSTSVQAYGGQMKTKTNGSAYWVGTDSNTIGLKMDKMGEYCIDGAFGDKNSTASITVADGHKGGLLRSFTGSSGVFTQCYYLPAVSQPYYLGLSIEKGTFVVNRFWLRNSQVWDPKNSAVVRTGGTLKTLDAGGTTWTGTANNAIKLTLAKSSGEYCIEGTVNADNTEGSLGAGNASGQGRGGVYTENKGKFTKCMNILSDDNNFTLGVDKGSITINRFVKK